VQLLAFVPLCTVLIIVIISRINLIEQKRFHIVHITVELIIVDTFQYLIGAIVYYFVF
jgi:hypothetical protein